MSETLDLLKERAELCQLQIDAEREKAAKDRRDRFAMAALTGLAAAPDPNGNPAHVYAKAAVALADALIAELDKEK